MKQLTRLVSLVVVVGLSAGRADAANMVHIDSVKSTIAGQLTATGTYNVDTGYTYKKIVIQAFPVGGGQGNCVLAKKDQPVAGQFQGTVTGLDKTITYNVTAILYVTENSSGNTFQFASNTVMKKPDGSG